MTFQSLLTISALVASLVLPAQALTIEASIEGAIADKNSFATETLLQGDFGSQPNHGLHPATWQINRFDGTQSGMQVQETHPRFAPFGDSFHPTTMGDVHSQFDADTPATTPPPEHSTVALAMAGAFAVLIRAQRSKRSH